MQSLTIFIGMAIFFHQVAMIKTQTVDIVQTAINNGNFIILVTALGATDLNTTLKGIGPFTVFAPTDAAFNKLPTGTVNDLLKPENKGKLSDILKYHVINGQALTSVQINAMTLPAQINTLEGDAITVSRNGSNLQVNDATVIIADVMATNGIIHAIDTVLMPPAKSSATYIYRNEQLFLILVCAISFSFRFL